MRLFSLSKTLGSGDVKAGDWNLTVTVEHTTAIYYHQVSAVDEASNESALSEKVSIEYVPYG